MNVPDILWFIAFSNFFLVPLVRCRIALYILARWRYMATTRTSPAAGDNDNNIADAVHI